MRPKTATSEIVDSLDHENRESSRVIIFRKCESQVLKLQYQLDKAVENDA